MMVSHGQRGFNAYCFKCGASEFEAHGQRSLTQLKAAREARMQQEKGGVIRLPSDFTSTIPPHGVTWVAEGGISPELARAYGLGYSPSYDRVVIPVYWEGQLATIQYRALHKWQKPKYINPPHASRKTVFKSDPVFRLPSAATILDACVICEDVLSGIRVGRLQDAYAALGTSLSDQAVLDIKKNYKTVLIWLDGDKAGVEGRKEMAKQLMRVGLVVHWCWTEKDPKRLTNEEIKETLHAGFNSPPHLLGA